MTIKEKVLSEIQEKINEKVPSGSERNNLIFNLISDLSDNLDENIDRIYFKKIILDFLDGGLFEFLFQPQFKSFIIKKIKFQINRLKQREYSLKKKINIIRSDEDSLKILYSLLNKLFLDSEYKNMDQFLNHIKERDRIADGNYDPEIEAELEVENQVIKIGYNFRKDRYSLNNKIFENKEEFFFRFINLLGINEFPKIFAEKNISKANTAMAVIRESMFLDFFSPITPNPLLVNEDKRTLFFQNIYHRVLEIIRRSIKEYIRKKKEFLKGIRQAIADYENKIKVNEGSMERFTKIKDGILNEYITKTYYNLDAYDEAEIDRQIIALDIRRGEIRDNRNEASRTIEIRKDLESLGTQKRDLIAEKRKMETRKKSVEHSLRGLELQEMNELFQSKIITDNLCFCGGTLPSDALKSIKDTKICPICGGAFKTENNNPKIRLEITQERRELTKLEKKIKESEGEIGNIENKISTLEKELSSIIKNFHNDSNKQEINEIELNLVELQKYKVKSSFFIEIQSNLDECHKENEEINKSLVEYKLQEDDLGIKIKICDNIISMLKEYHTNTHYRKTLEERFDKFQLNFLNIFGERLGIGLSFKKQGDFKDILVESTHLDEQIKNFSYYLSILRLSLGNSQKNYSSFVNFPFLCVNGINANNLNESYEILKDIHEKYDYFQILIFFPDEFNLNYSFIEEFNVIKEKKGDTTLDDYFNSSKAGKLVSSPI